MHGGIVDSLVLVALLGNAPVVDSTRLLRDLESPAPSVREQAARALGSRGDRVGVPSLVKALTDSEALTESRIARQALSTR